LKTVSSARRETRQSCTWKYRGLFLRVQLIKRLHRWFPSAEILIIENGCINFADGFTRAKYLEAHLAQVEKARLNRIPLAAYICWSITSNREWNLPFSPASDFGLYNIRLDTDLTLERRKTHAADTYKQIIRRMNLASI
jgi:beta-glucosidase/6-phospho-beta-glucosidase/beta-galactosidase